MIKWDLSQGCNNDSLHKAINVINYINKREIISKDAEKASDNFQHAFRITPLINVGIEGTYITIIKAICNKQS